MPVSGNVLSPAGFCTVAGAGSRPDGGKGEECGAAPRPELSTEDGRARSRGAGTQSSLGHYSAARAHRAFEEQLLAWRLQDLAHSVRVSEDSSHPSGTAEYGGPKKVGAAQPATRVVAGSAPTPPRGVAPPSAPAFDPDPDPDPDPVTTARQHLFSSLPAVPAASQSSPPELASAAHNPPTRLYPENHVHIHVHRDDSATTQPQAGAAQAATATVPPKRGAGDCLPSQLQQSESLSATSAPATTLPAPVSAPVATRMQGMSQVRPPSPLTSESSAALPRQGGSPSERRSAPPAGPQTPASLQSHALQRARSARGEVNARAAAPSQATAPSRETATDSAAREQRRRRYLAKGATGAEGSRVPKGAHSSPRARGGKGTPAPRSGQRAPHTSPARKGQRGGPLRRGREMISPPRPSRATLLPWDVSLPSPKDAEVSVSPWGNQILSRANSHTELLGEVRRVAQSLEQSNWVGEASTRS